ncbi:MAG: isoamylase early set domain-containing protein [Lewinellaceae bacterium]|nr:isoamylase early set domain-containing protein [Lewinellaceae bacterium]
MSLKKQFFDAKHTVKVTFCLPEEAFKEAKEVKVFGDFNNWESAKGIPMKVKNGEFQATVELDTGKEYQFRYLIDNKVWENDAEADNYVPSPFGSMNSVVMAFPEKTDLQL